MASGSQKQPGLWTFANLEADLSSHFRGFKSQSLKERCPWDGPHSHHYSNHAPETPQRATHSHCHRQMTRGLCSKCVTPTRKASMIGHWTFHWDQRFYSNYSDWTIPFSRWVWVLIPHLVNEISVLELRSPYPPVVSWHLGALLPFEKVH